LEEICEVYFYTIDENQERFQWRKKLAFDLDFWIFECERKGVMKRKLGRTGISLNPVGLGGMPLSIKGRPSREAAINVIKRSVDSGVDFIDTANAYCLDEAEKGHNEALIAEALKSFSDREVLVATKGGCTRERGDWGVDGRPESLRVACEKSLKDLDQDHIALYYLHAPDSAVPLQESIGALGELQKEGKILHIGVSNFNLSQLKEALELVRVEAVQNRYHPLMRKDLDSGLVRFCEEQEISFVAHSPVGGHRLHKEVTSQGLLQQLAEKYDVSSYCICLRWVLQSSASMLAIPGASKEASILDSLKAHDFELSPADLEKIGQLSLA